MAKKSKLLNQLGTSLNEIKRNIDVEDLSLIFLEELTDSIAYNVIDYRADITYQPL